MSARVRCKLCPWRAELSEDDPDATIDDGVTHVAAIHGRDAMRDDLLTVEGAGVEW